MRLLNSHRPNDAAEDQRQRSTVLVQATELADSLGRATPPILLVVRSSDPPVEGRWSEAPRIPGALDVSLAADLAGPGDTRAGSRPLPHLGDLQASARRWGLRASSEVVVYDHEGGLQAARAWWVLRWAGVGRVRLLDGGYDAWCSAGLPIAGEPGRAHPGDIVLSPGHMPQLDATAAARLAREGLLLDSRIRLNYEGGDSAPGEAPRGHIPGAVNVPAPSNLDDAGAFLDPTRLRSLYAAAGVDGVTPVGVYCGAGVSAAHDILALASIGIDAPMYVGSWSAWSADPTRPVARGPAPG